MKHYFKISVLAGLILCGNLYAQASLSPSITFSQGQLGCPWVASEFKWVDGQTLSSTALHTELNKKNQAQIVIEPQSVVDTILHLAPDTVTSYVFHCDSKRQLKPGELVVFSFSYQDPTSGETVMLPEMRVRVNPPAGGMQPPTGVQPPAGMQPPTGVQPPAGMQPPTGVQPPASMQPPTGMQPPAGMQPPTGMQPPAGMQPPSNSMNPSTGPAQNTPTQ